MPWLLDPRLPMSFALPGAVVLPPSVGQVCEDLPCSCQKLRVLLGLFVARVFRAPTCLDLRNCKTPTSGSSMQKTSQKELAAHLFLTPRWVRNLIREGVLPQPGPNGHDLDACRGAYLEHLRDLVAGRVKPKPPAGGDGDFSDLLEQEKYRKLKRENDLADETVAPIEILTHALEKVGLQIVALLEAMPLEMKRANPRLTGHDIMQVKKSVSKCCTAISEIQLENVGQD